MIKYVRNALLILLFVSLVWTPAFAQGPAVKVIELRDGRLPARVSGKDITGPIVFMIDGKLPGGLSEQELIDIEATVLSFRSDETPPRLITESMRQKFADMGIPVEKLVESGAIVVDDATIAQGKAYLHRLLERQAKRQSSRAHPEQVGDCISWTNIYEAFPPGSGVVANTASQYCGIAGTLGVLAYTTDYSLPWYPQMWLDSDQRVGWSVGVNGSFAGLEGHLYCLQAYYSYNGITWDVGFDCMTL